MSKNRNGPVYAMNMYGEMEV